MIHNLQYSNFLQFQNLSQHKGLKHFTTTIHGGISTGNYSTFNLGISSGDTLENILKNRRILALQLGISSEKLFIPHQTHSDKYFIIDENFLSLPLEEQQNRLNGVDAIITNLKGIGIVISTADCVPVLIYDPIQQVLATIHARWKGTVTGIVTKTIWAMIEKYGCHPEHLKAGIGPSISQNCFEVGEEVTEAFIQAGFSIQNIAYKHPDTGKHHINLWEANKILCMESGILPENIEISGLCTFSNPELFFSVRRQTIKSGRMLTGGVYFKFIIRLSIFYFSPL